jgi:hypothetical protein
VLLQGNSQISGKTNWYKSIFVNNYLGKLKKSYKKRNFFWAIALLILDILLKVKNVELNLCLGALKAHLDVPITAIFFRKRSSVRKKD